MRRHHQLHKPSAKEPKLQAASDPIEHANHLVARINKKLEMIRNLRNETNPKPVAFYEKTNEKKIAELEVKIDKLTAELIKVDTEIIGAPDPNRPEFLCERAGASPPNIRRSPPE